MTRMMMLGLVVCLTACGGSGSHESESESTTTTTGSEDGTTTQDDVHHTPGASEHDCVLRQQRECADLACHWVPDPNAPVAAQAEATPVDEDPSLRDDVTIGPRTAHMPGDGELCVQAADGGAATPACPQICCEVCPRE